MSHPGINYVDDPTIKDDSPLWRRIPPWHVIRDENRGRLRPSSSAFDDHPDGTPMSVILGEEVLAGGRPPEAVLVGQVGFSLASVAAGLARDNRQGVARNPTPEEPAHAEVFGKKTRSVMRAFAIGSEWIIPPANAITAD